MMMTMRVKGRRRVERRVIEIRKLIPQEPGLHRPFLIPLEYSSRRSSAYNRAMAYPECI